MTQEFTWRKNPSAPLWWLTPKFGPLSVGLMHRDAPSESRRPEVYDWRVALWVPKELFIAYLPADMPEAEALDAAKTLILLSLKERSQS